MEKVNSGVSDAKNFEVVLKTGKTNPSSADPEKTLFNTPLKDIKAVNNVPFLIFQIYIVNWI